MTTALVGSANWGCAPRHHASQQCRAIIRGFSARPLSEANDVVSELGARYGECGPAIRAALEPDNWQRYTADETMGVLSTINSKGDVAMVEPLVKMSCDHPNLNLSKCAALVLAQIVWRHEPTDLDPVIGKAPVESSILAATTLAQFRKRESSRLVALLKERIAGATPHEKSKVERGIARLTR